MRFFALFALVFAAATAGGCASVEPLQSSADVTVVQASELPPPQGGEHAAARGAYAIGPYDRLILDVMGFPELMNRRIQVDAAGMITVPIAGSVQAGGLTTAQLVDRITEQLRRGYVRNPEVAVNLEESLSSYVTVDGQVVQPGNYPIVGDMSLMRSVAAARGLNESAELEDVVIFRTVNGQRMAALYNLQAIRRGAYADPPIYARDVVVVGDSPSRRLFRDLLTASPLLVSPIVAILNNSSL